MQVLVVEDEVLIRMLVCDLLEDAGFSCLAAANAAEALLLLDHGRPPALLVTDYNLGPGLDGRALAEEVRRRLPGIGVVYVTGNPECFEDHPFLPTERLVAKPFAGCELIAAVGALLPPGWRHHPCTAIATTRPTPALMLDLH